MAGLIRIYLSRITLDQKEEAKSEDTCYKYERVCECAHERVLACMHVHECARRVWIN